MQLNVIYRRFFLLIFSLCFLISGCSLPTQRPTPYQAEVYFSPNGGIREHIIKIINEATTSIDIAIFDLTLQDIRLALEKVKTRGVKIRIIADSRQAKGPHSVVQSLIDAGFAVKMRHGRGRGIMHNKFAIFDKKILFTGSYNWTESAERNNYENALFVSDGNIIKRYQKELL